MYSIITYKHITLLTLSVMAVMMAPAVSGMGGCKPGRETVGGGHVMPVAPAAGGTRGRKPGRETVDTAPLTRHNGLLKNPDCSW